MSTSSFRTILKRIHNDERGSVSLENILIVGAITLPVLIFTLKFGWPKIKDYFFEGTRNLETESSRIVNGQ